MTTATYLSPISSLDRYAQDVDAFPLLSREEEYNLSRRYRDHNDVYAAHKLVTSNLRFVIKIARSYKGYGLSLPDLIQEGNIGLMHAVKKFDPERGYRLLTYATWWIKAHIQNFIMKSFSMVKIGTGKVARRLFFNMRSAFSAIEQERPDQSHETIATLVSEKLDIPEDKVNEMHARMALKDFQLDAPVSEETSVSFTDLLPSDESDMENALAERQQHEILHKALDAVKPTLNERDIYILENRLLTDEPLSFAQVAEKFGVSRQRIQQVEERIINKLRSQMKHHAESMPAI